MEQACEKWSKEEALLRNSSLFISCSINDFISISSVFSSFPPVQCVKCFVIPLPPFAIMVCNKCTLFAVLVSQLCTLAVLIKGNKVFNMKAPSAER